MQLAPDDCRTICSIVIVGSETATSAGELSEALVDSVRDPVTDLSFGI